MSLISRFIKRNKIAPSNSQSTLKINETIPKEIPRYFKDLDPEEFKIIFLNFYNAQLEKDVAYYKDFKAGKPWPDNEITALNVHNYAHGDGKNRVKARAYSAMINHLNTDGFYKGELKDEKPHGKGTKTFAVGCFYDGMWENGLLKTGVIQKSYEHGIAEIQIIDEKEMPIVKITFNDKSTYEGVSYQ